MGDTCTLMADSCNEWQKTLQYCKVISLHLNKKFFFNLGERTWADTVRNGFKGGASSSQNLDNGERATIRENMSSVKRRIFACSVFLQTHSFSKIEVQLTYSFVPTFAVWQNDSIIHIQTFFLNILFHYGLPQDIDYNALHYTVGICCLSVLRITVSIRQSHTPRPNASLQLLLLLSCFSRVRLCETPQMASHQAPALLNCTSRTFL